MYTNKDPRLIQGTKECISPRRKAERITFGLIGMATLLFAIGCCVVSLSNWMHPLWAVALTLFVFFGGAFISAVSMVWRGW